MTEPAPKRKTKRPPPKRPPPKRPSPKRLRRQPVTVLDAAVEAVGAEMAGAELSGRGYLRWAAGLYFATRPHTTIAEMSKHERFGQVPRKVLERWGAADGWEEQRAQFVAHLRSAALAQFGLEIARVRQEQFRDLCRLFDDTIQLARILPPTETDPGGPYVPPRSWEGVVGAAVRLGDLMETWRAKTLGELQDAGSGGDDGVGDPVSEMSDDEARALGRELLRLRRARK